MARAFLDGFRSQLGRVSAVVQGLFDPLTELVPANTQTGQDLSRQAFVLVKQTEQEVFGADVVVIEVAGLVDREFEHLLASGVKGIWPSLIDEPPAPTTLTT